VVVSGIGRALGAGLWALLWLTTGLAQTDGAAGARKVDFRGRAPSPGVQQVAGLAYASADAGGRAFAIVDKKDARLYVFDADGRLAGDTAALLGQARGDDSAPGVAQRVVSGIPVEQRTTPAGRFVSVPGHNHHGEAIVWVDYAAAVAIHRLRPAAAVERRPQRLASATPDDNRISLGCVVVAADFYDEVVAPLLGSRYGVVYVLPETRDLAEVFGLGAAAEL